MNCPKCQSVRTSEQREADEFFCWSCFNTFYAQHRVISNIVHMVGPTGPNKPRKPKPTISGVRELYKKVGLV